MSQWMAVELIGGVMALILAVRAYRSHGHSSDKAALLAAIWVAIIGGLALVLKRLGE